MARLGILPARGRGEWCGLRVSLPGWRVGAALSLAALLALLSACVDYGIGLDFLPGSSGWQTLPLRNWVLNEGLGPVTIVYCQPSRCEQPSVVATFEARGETVRRLEHALADPKTLLTAKRVDTQRARDPRFKRKPEKTAPKSSETAERLDGDGLKGYRVALIPKLERGHSAYAVVLAKREEDGVMKVAVAVSADPDLALREAKEAATTF